jgi:hypothetical protein
MTKLRLKTYLRTALTTSLVVASMTACAAETQQMKPGKTVAQTTPAQQAQYLPFSIVFDQKGTPHVVDQDNNPIEPTEVNFPIKTQAIRSVESITTVSYEGSHMYLVKFGGLTYLIRLPH